MKLDNLDLSTFNYFVTLQTKIGIIWLEISIKLLFYQQVKRKYFCLKDEVLYCYEQII